MYTLPGEYGPAASPTTPLETTLAFASSLSKRASRKSFMGLSSTSRKKSASSGVGKWRVISSMLMGGLSSRGLSTETSLSMRIRRSRNASPSLRENLANSSRVRAGSFHESRCRPSGKSCSDTGS